MAVDKHRGGLWMFLVGPHVACLLLAPVWSDATWRLGLPRRASRMKGRPRCLDALMPQALHALQAHSASVVMMSAMDIVDGPARHTSIGQSPAARSR